MRKRKFTNQIMAFNIENECWIERTNERTKEIEERKREKQKKMWQKAINNHNELLISNKYIQINHVQQQKALNCLITTTKNNKTPIANDARSAKKKHTNTQKWSENEKKKWTVRDRTRER